MKNSKLVILIICILVFVGALALFALHIQFNADNRDILLTECKGIMQRI